MELTIPQMNHTMRRFPTFKLSYESISHKKVSAEYDVALGIPIGKKFFAWFTFYKSQDVYYLLDLNKEKKVCRAVQHPNDISQELSHGTIVYGTIVTLRNVEWFIVEDIFSYKGIMLKEQTFSNKLDYMESFIYDCTTGPHRFVLPMIWETPKHGDDFLYLPAEINKAVGYPIHHIQYRPLHAIMPYLNYPIAKKLNSLAKPTCVRPSYIAKYLPDFNKPQYRYTTVFQVMADLQYDIYHLYAYGKNKEVVYFDVAYIPNCKTSVFMNGLFRNIRENSNLDYIEESDTEDDFENIAEDKYVDLKKKCFIECAFQSKFKRWIPIRLAEKQSKIVHISKLVRDYVF